MSALPTEADMLIVGINVCYVPEADNCGQLVKICKNCGCRALHPIPIQLLGGAYYPDGLTKTPRTFD